MAEDTPVTYADLPDELKKKHDEIKATSKPNSSAPSTEPAPMASGGRVSPEGALDGVDLSARRRTHQSLRRRSTTWWLTRCTATREPGEHWERVARRPEIMSHRYSVGTGSGTFKERCRSSPVRMGSRNRRTHSHVVTRLAVILVTTNSYEPPKEIPHGYTCAYVPDATPGHSRTRLLTARNGRRNAEPILRSNLGWLSTPRRTSKAQLLRWLRTGKASMAGQILDTTGKDGDEGSGSHSKETEEAAPRDRLRQDGKRYVTEGEVKNIRYRDLSLDHLLNKYVSRRPTRRSGDDDDRVRRPEKPKTSSADRDEEEHERCAKGKAREQDDEDGTGIVLLQHCRDSGMSRLPTIGNCPECNQKKKEAANVSVFERLGPLPPQSKRAESPRWEDLEDSENEGQEEEEDRIGSGGTQVDRTRGYGYAMEASHPLSMGTGGMLRPGFEGIGNKSSDLPFKDKAKSSLDVQIHQRKGADLIGKAQEELGGQLTLKILIYGPSPSSSFLNLWHDGLFVATSVALHEGFIPVFVVVVVVPPHAETLRWRVALEGVVVVFFSLFFRGGAAVPGELVVLTFGLQFPIGEDRRSSSPPVKDLSSSDQMEEAWLSSSQSSGARISGGVSREESDP
ncbi:hypothetical protein QYE76_001733 [Lolium multiflorum]|uniref:Uncharacterized protein n=1 Tax=Lolium multiflorum TaxID=4521 RepID=A0AAD8RKC8_LOLMU|nr:hypothetical protein QYE76_001733 [Lolium multiflorum]